MKTDFDAEEPNTVDSGKLFGILSIVVFFVFALGVASGSLYCAKCAVLSSDIIDRITAIFDHIANDTSAIDISLNALLGYLASAAAVIIAAKFKRGFILSFFAVLRAGFINGFTLSAAVCAFGAKGILCMITMSFEYAAAALALIMLTALSASYAAAASAGSEKNLKKILIIFSIIAISIFCGLSFFRGCVSTIFIKFICGKILYI